MQCEGAATARFRNVETSLTFTIDPRRHESTRLKYAFILGVLLACLLLSAGIAANIGGQMPEMRGAWVARAVR